MENFQETFEARKWSFISAFLICMTAPLIFFIHVLSLLFCKTDLGDSLLYGNEWSLPWLWTCGNDGNKFSFPLILICVNDAAMAVTMNIIAHLLTFSFYDLSFHLIQNIFSNIKYRLDTQSMYILFTTDFVFNETR